jgi:hypothetical protein
VIKLATHGKDIKKDVIKKYAKTTNCITVADNATTVAIGYAISFMNL